MLRVVIIAFAAYGCSAARILRESSSSDMPLPTYWSYEKDPPALEETTTEQLRTVCPQCTATVARS
jgi:hypothetical protein